MPDPILGFSGNDIVTHVQNYIGNKSPDFKSYIELSLPLLEFWYSRMHTWNYLRKRNLSLTVVSGTAEYALTSANLGGVSMLAKDVERIYSVASGIYLKKTTIDKIRRVDPELDDGTTSTDITHWAVGDNATVIFYPPNFNDTEVKVEGKILPAALSILTNYPTIPYDQQFSFISLVIAVALDRESDDRANRKRQEAEAMIRADIAAEMKIGSDMDEERFKHHFEKAFEGVGADSIQLFDPLNQSEY